MQDQKRAEDKTRQKADVKSEEKKDIKAKLADLSKVGNVKLRAMLNC